MTWFCNKVFDMFCIRALKMLLFIILFFIILMRCLLIKGFIVILLMFLWNYSILNLFILFLRTHHIMFCKILNCANLILLINIKNKTWFKRYCCDFSIDRLTWSWFSSSDYNGSSSSTGSSIGSLLSSENTFLVDILPFLFETDDFF